MSYWLDIMLNNVKVTSLGDRLYRVSGIRTNAFFKELQRVFGTVRFRNGMFEDITSTSFTVSRFFLFDFYQIVETLVEDGTRYYNQSITEHLFEELKKLPPIANSLKKFPSKLNRDQLNRFVFKPLPKQAEFFDVYDQKTQQYDLNGYILGVPPGGGKTYTSLALMAMLEKDIVFVFSPNNALNEVWELTLNSVKDTDTWVYPKPNSSYNKTHYVFSHENTRFAKAEIWKILQANPKASIGIIVDECHKFTELSSEMTQNLIDICKMSGSKDILFMSGTPFKAMGIELIPFIMSTDPTFSSNDLAGFRKIFGASGLTARNILAARIGRLLYKVDKADIVNNDVTTYIVNVKFQGSERFTLPVIKKKMEAFVVERVKFYKENEDKFIKEYERIINVFSRSSEAKIRPGEFAMYKRNAALIRATKNLREVKDEMVASNLYEKTKIIPTLSPKDKIIFRDVKSVYKYVHLKIQGEALGQVLGAERSACNAAIVANLDNGLITVKGSDEPAEAWDIDDIFVSSQSKVVMFTDFIEVLLKTEELLRKKGYHPEVVYGDTNKDLSNILTKVEKDPKANPIIATYKSLSTAVPLTICDSVVLLNVPYRDYIYQQTTSRVDRLGQIHPVKIYLYQLDTGVTPNISTRSHEIMAWSKQMTDELLGMSGGVEDEDIIEDEIEIELNKAVRDPRSLTKRW